MTISRLAFFIIGIVALIVAVLSYSYGAASFHVAERAYQLQQLEFCMAHNDDAVSPVQMLAFTCGGCLTYTRSKSWLQSTANAGLRNQLIPF